MGRLLGVLQGAAIQASFFPCLLVTGAEMAWNPIRHSFWLLLEWHGKPAWAVASQRRPGV